MARSKQTLVFPTPRQLTMGFMYLLICLFLLPMALTSLNGLLLRPLSASWLNFLYYCLNFLVLLSLFQKFLRQSLLFAGKHVWSVLGYSFLGFWIYQAMSFLLGIAIRWLDPGFSNVNDSSLSGQFAENYWIMAIGTVLLVPVAEELLYRGVVFTGIYRKHRIAAYILSMLIFASIHVMVYIGSYSPLVLLLCFLQYLPAGWVLAWSYEKSGCIFVPILIHTAVNTMGLLALR